MQPLKVTIQAKVDKMIRQVRMVLEPLLHQWLSRKNVRDVITLPLMCCVIHVLPIGEKCKRIEIPSELVTLLTEMEEIAEERELKRMKFEADLEEDKSNEERKHEERMQSMMMRFMSHMMTMFSSSRVPSTFPSSSKPCTSFMPSSVPSYLPTSHFDTSSPEYTPGPNKSSLAGHTLQSQGKGGSGDFVYELCRLPEFWLTQSCSRFKKCAVSPIATNFFRD